MTWAVSMLRTEGQLQVLYGGEIRSRDPVTTSHRLGVIVRAKGVCSPIVCARADRFNAPGHEHRAVKGDLAHFSGRRLPPMPVNLLARWRRATFYSHCWLPAAIQSSATAAVHD